MEMDSGVSHLHVRELINPKQIISKQFQGILPPGTTPPTLREIFPFYIGGSPKITLLNK